METPGVETWADSGAQMGRFAVGPLATETERERCAPANVHFLRFRIFLIIAIVVNDILFAFPGE